MFELNRELLLILLSIAFAVGPVNSCSNENLKLQLTSSYKVSSFFEDVQKKGEFIFLYLSGLPISCNCIRSRLVKKPDNTWLLKSTCALSSRSFPYNIKVKFEESTNSITFGTLRNIQIVAFGENVVALASCLDFGQKFIAVAVPVDRVHDEKTDVALEDVKNTFETIGMSLSTKQYSTDCLNNE